MPPVIVTGGPGAGKTTLLAALADMGYVTVEESVFFDRGIIDDALGMLHEAKCRASRFHSELSMSSASSWRAPSNPYCI